ncbi:fungal-specific transcription factor domain-containing protein [Scheffersomyces coipomensis]|uniref:fungal-specific transcription factor domain-containing protein n=1 Tax=Scheffersomyces coipomensis TaxID=1788519 RepID=UPI00315D33E0
MEAGQYVCSHEKCGKIFSRKDYLIRHQINHQNIRPFACQQCNLPFTRSDLLEKHYNSKSHRKKKVDLFIRHDEEEDDTKESPPKRTKVNNPIPELIEIQYTPQSIQNDLPSTSVGNYLWLFEDQFDEFESTIENTPDLTQPSSHTYTSSPDPSINQANSEKVEINDLRRQEIIDLLNLDQFDQYSTTRLNYFLDLFWDRFSPMFPFIHYATFSPSDVDIYLITIMINIGMAHSPIIEEYEHSIDMAKVFRRLIFDAVGDRVVLPLSLMQALLLHNFECKYYGDKLTYEMAQLFHGTNVNFLRFTGYFDELQEPNVIRLSSTTESDDKEYYKQWHTWIHYECCKRTAYFAFICDSQHGTLFKHQALSAFALQLELPCTDAVWNANDPKKFQDEYFKQPHGLLFSRPKLKFDTNDQNYNSIASGPSMQMAKAGGEWPSFLWSLRSMMLPYKEDQKEYSMDCYSQFSRFIILHGLVSICWDMRWRGLFDLGIVSKKKLNDLSGKLQRSFTNWRGYLDLHIANANDYAIGNNRKLNSTVALNNYGLSIMFWANITSFQLALVSLYADTASIVKFATDYLITNDIDFKGPSRNYQLIESWARSPNGKSSVYEASRFIRILLSNDSDTISSIPHIPWTLFISCLVIWSFEVKRDCPDGLQSRGSMQLSYFKYTMKPNDSLDEQVSHKDATEYVSMILDESDEFIETSEVFWKRQQLVVGILAYGLIYFRKIKWRYTSELTKTLIGILEKQQGNY